MGGPVSGGGDGIMDTLSGWCKQWQFWVIVALAVLALILFIAMLVYRAKYNKCANPETTTTTPATTTSGFRRRRRQGYMPDPGIPSSKLLFDTYARANYAASGYTAGMSQDPDVVLKNALQQ
jgi:hypothetical protein